MTVAGRVAQYYAQYSADAVFVDGGGVGGGVVDRLRQMHIPVVDVQFGAKPDGMGYLTGNEGERYYNKRGEMWGSMRAWLRQGGAIPDDQNLKEQLSNPMYAFSMNNEIVIEKKEDMRKRGLESPDIADALALTFAQYVAPHAHAGGDGPKKPEVEYEYDPFEFMKVA